MSAEIPNSTMELLRELVGNDISINARGKLEAHFYTHANEGGNSTHTTRFLDKICAQLNKEGIAAHHHLKKSVVNIAGSRSYAFDSTLTIDPQSPALEAAVIRLLAEEQVNDRTGDEDALWPPAKEAIIDEEARRLKERITQAR